MMAATAKANLPPSLVPLADVLPRQFANPARAAAFARNWQSAAASAADADTVPCMLVAGVLEPFTHDGPCAGFAARLLALHKAEALGRSIQRSEWAAARRALLALDRDTLTPEAGATAQLCEAAAWPAATGSSALVEVLFALKRIASLSMDDDWDQSRQGQAESALEAIYEEAAETRAHGKTPDYKAIFHTCHPELAIGFERNLDRSNRAFAQAGEDFAQACLGALQHGTTASTA